MRNYFLLLLFVALFSACTKDDQRTINRLDGEWAVSAYTVNGQPLPAENYNAMRFLFKGCAVKSYDYCDGSLTLNSSNTVEFKFSIGTSGTDFSIDFIALDLEDIAGTIESSRKEHILRFSSGGEAQEITLEKF